MPNPDLIKTYTAGGAIPARTIVKFDTADFQVVAAAASSDGLIGVSTEVASASGDRVDVIHDDIAEVICGGTVTRGDYLTSDSAGKAVTCAPSTGTKAQYIGKALRSGVAGDIIDCMLGFGQLTTP